MAQHSFLIPMRRPSVATSTGGSRCSRTTSGTPSLNDEHSAPQAALSVVVKPYFDWSGDAGQQAYEFTSMVRASHATGIEVILDVVDNHTTEGNHLGPTLSFQGIDNASDYRLEPDDLAATLAREFFDVDKLATFFELVQQDPVVSQVELITEPWDIGPGGYQVGNFPPQWTEWNDKFRDTVRDF
jgi:isoamylase